PPEHLRRARLRRLDDGLPRPDHRPADDGRPGDGGHGRRGGLSVRRAPRLPPEELAPYLLAAPDPPAPIDWAALFGNDRPVELEVGFGKGLFLLTAAIANPGINFVGVEVVRKYQLFTATRMAKRNLRHVRVACA